jgi:HK97 family phage portal protein
MGFVRNLERGHWAGLKATATINRDPLSDFWYQPTGWVTSSGVRMSRDAAMTLSAFWSGVQKIGKSIASVPCVVYEQQDDGGKRRVKPREPGIGQLALDLARQPNASQTAFDFFLMALVHILTRGLFVSVIQDRVDSYGQHLVPLHPDRTTPGRIPSGTMTYDYTAPSGKTETYLQDEVFAVWGMTVDGVTPMSVIQYGARSMGTALAAEESAASFFARGMTAQFGITYKDHLEPTTANALAQTLAGQNAGLKNGHAPLVLGDDPQIVADLGIKPQDAQLLATRAFGIEEVARWLDLPKHMLKADQGTGSYASMEVLSAEFVTYTLLPHAVQIEQSIKRDLIIAPDKYFAEFNLNKLMRGNLLDRYRAHQIGIFSGLETRNEARAEEGRNPLPGLDQPLEPMNYVGVGDDTGPKRQDAPSTPGGPSQSGARAADRLEQRLTQLHTDIAARLVRREQHEVEKLAKKHASDAGGWAQAVPAFYADFTAQIADSLRIDKTSAAEYAATHAMALVREGLPAMKDWDRDAPIALATRAQQACAA